jgi:WD40 repeat protein
MSLLAGFLAATALYMLPLERPRATLPAWCELGTFAFSPNSGQVVTSHRYQYLENLDDPEEVVPVPPPDNAFFSVRLWDAANGQLLNILYEGKKEEITTLAFSPDGRRIAGAADIRHAGECAIKLWDVATCALLAEYQCKDWWSIDRAVTFSKENEPLIWDSRLRKVLDPKTAKSVVDYSNAGIGGREKPFGTPSGFVVVNNSEIVQVMNMSTGKLVAEHRMPRADDLYRPELTPDGQGMVSMLRNPEPGEPRIMIGTWGVAGSVHVWDASRPSSRRVRKAERPASGYGQLSPDGRWLITHPIREPHPWVAWLLPRDRVGPSTVCIHDLYEDRELADLGEGWSHAFSPDGKTLAIGRRNGTLELWDFPVRKAWWSISGGAALTAGIVWLLLSVWALRRRKDARGKKRGRSSFP